MKHFFKAKFSFKIDNYSFKKTLTSDKTFHKNS